MTSLTLVRRIAARPSIVFDALTTPEGVAAWWGPDNLPVIRAQIDARVGGVFRVCFQTLDGQRHEAWGEYLEVDPPRRLAMSWRYAFGGEPEELGRTSRIDIELKPIEGGTELTFTHAQLRNEASVISHQRGWTGSLAKLVRKLAQTPSDPAVPTSAAQRPGT